MSLFRPTSRAAALLGLAFFALAASAASPDALPTNLSSAYPQPTCVKPVRLLQPDHVTNQMEIQMWSAKVESYNNAQKQYMQCVKDYLAAAQADANRITETANNLVRIANEQ